jgi:hypothetical protein
MELIASRKYDVSMPLSGDKEVGTAIKKCVAGAIRHALVVQVIDEYRLSVGATVSRRFFDTSKAIML